MSNVSQPGSGGPIIQPGFGDSKTRSPAAQQAVDRLKSVGVFNPEIGRSDLRQGDPLYDPGSDEYRKQGGKPIFVGYTAPGVTREQRERGIELLKEEDAGITATADQCASVDEDGRCAALVSAQPWLRSGTEEKKRLVDIFWKSLGGGAPGLPFPGDKPKEYETPPTKPVGFGELAPPGQHDLVDYSLPVSVQPVDGLQTPVTQDRLVASSSYPQLLGAQDAAFIAPADTPIQQAASPKISTPAKVGIGAVVASVAGFLLWKFVL